MPGIELSASLRFKPRGRPGKAALNEVAIIPRHVQMSWETALAREFPARRISTRNPPVVRTLGDAINYLHAYGAGSRAANYHEVERLLFEAVRTGTSGDVLEATEAFEGYWA